MRIIDTFAKDGFKITLFQTQERFLVQIEDPSAMICWKLPKIYSLEWLNKEGFDLMLTYAKQQWKQMIDVIPPPSSIAADELEFPTII